MQFRKTCERAVIQGNTGDLAVIIGGQRQPHRRQEVVFVGQAFILGRQRHLDVKVAFQRDDLEGHDKEHQQLKHDVNHRCHLQFDRVLPTARRAANFHSGSPTPVLSYPHLLWPATQTSRSHSPDRS